MDEKRIAAIFKAFCDENRIRIIKLLRSGEKCACKLLEEINVTQPTLSHHMKILCDAEIVVGRKRGKMDALFYFRKRGRTGKSMFATVDNT